MKHECRRSLTSRIWHFGSTTPFSLEQHSNSTLQCKRLPVASVLILDICGADTPALRSYVQDPFARRLLRFEVPELLLVRRDTGGEHKLHKSVSLTHVGDSKPFTSVQSFPLGRLTARSLSVRRILINASVGRMLLHRLRGTYWYLPLAPYILKVCRLLSVTTA